MLISNGKRYPSKFDAESAAFTVEMITKKGDNKIQKKLLVPEMRERLNQWAAEHASNTYLETSIPVWNPDKQIWMATAKLTIEADGVRICVETCGFSGGFDYESACSAVSFAEGRALVNAGFGLEPTELVGEILTPSRFGCSFKPRVFHAPVETPAGPVDTRYILAQDQKEWFLTWCMEKKMSFSMITKSDPNLYMHEGDVGVCVAVSEVNISGQNHVFRASESAANAFEAGDWRAANTVLSYAESKALTALGFGVPSYKVYEGSRAELKGFLAEAGRKTTAKVDETEGVQHENTAPEVPVSDDSDNPLISTEVEPAPRAKAENPQPVREPKKPETPDAEFGEDKLSYEEAMEFQVPTGSYKGRTLRELVLGLNKTYPNWVVNQSSESFKTKHPDLVEACKVVLANQNG